MVGVPYPTRRKNEGKNLDRKHLELSKQRRVFARKKRRGMRVERKSDRKKHNAARATSRLEELRSDRGTAGGAEGQIHSSPQLHGGVSARSEHLRFNRRERLGRKER